MKKAQNAWVISDGVRYHAPEGDVAIPFARKGTYSIRAEKECAIRSTPQPVSIEELREISVRLRIEDNGRPIFDKKIRFCGLQTTDMNGSRIEIRRPIALGTLEAASRKRFFKYQIIQTAEGLIIASIAGLCEDNRNGSWWVR